jgi:hypothetical protein
LIANQSHPDRFGVWVGGPNLERVCIRWIHATPL